LLIVDFRLLIETEIHTVADFQSAIKNPQSTIEGALAVAEI